MILYCISESEKNEILEMRNSPKLYSKMMESVCPNVFGHPEVLVVAALG